MSWGSIQIEKACLPTRIRDPREAPEASFRYVDISCIDRELKVITSTSEIMGKDAPSRARKEIRAGNTIVSTVRPNLNAVAMIPPELHSQVASTGFCVLQPNSQIMEDKYLFYFTQTPDFISILGSKVRGAHYPAVSDQAVKEIVMPLPPLSEQRRIVEILDQADTLRKKRAEADVKAARILPALFHKMFGDPATNPRGWRVISLGDVILDTRNGLYKPSEFYGSGIAILKMFNIQSGELDLNRIDLIEVTDDEYEAYRLSLGDILINRVNTPDLVGKCAVITEEVGKAVFESKNIRIRVRPDLVIPEFIVAYLNSPFGHGSMRSGVKHAIGMATINNTDLRNTRVLLPPLNAQMKWSDAICQMRSLGKMEAILGRKVDTIFRNLLQRAFCGDLTARWRHAHMKELLAEMEVQSRLLDAQVES